MSPAQLLTVLYIDDDPALARLVQKGLSRHGYLVETVSSAEEGLARVGNGSLAAIALDHFLPTGTGLDFLERLRGYNNPPPVVYVTASGETPVAVAALKAGAVDYVPKSVDEEFIELLVSAIDQAVEKGRLERARDEAERAVREARDRAEVLLHEVNHRVANSLAIVGALVRMQSNEISDPAFKNILTEIQARISAVAGVHRRLYTSANVRQVEISDYLMGLMQELEASMKASGKTAHVHVRADTISVPTDKAVSIGVIVTELVTNAFKYAYESGDPGEIRVVCERLPGGKVMLSVEDDGAGWDGSGTVRGTGLGNRVVAAMARGLGTAVVYQPGRGCRAMLEFDV